MKRIGFNEVESKVEIFASFSKCGPNWTAEFEPGVQCGYSEKSTVKLHLVMFGATSATYAQAVVCRHTSNVTVSVPSSHSCSHAVILVL